MDAPQEPRWLDAEESQAWRALAKALETLPAALDAQLRRDAGISHFEYKVLALLSEAPDRTLRMSELAMWAGSSLPRLSQVVARLEQRGWVRRIPDPADGRYTLAILTDQGQEKVTEAAPGHVEEVRRLVFDPLTKAQSRQLREIGERITRAIDTDDQPLPAVDAKTNLPTTIKHLLEWVSCHPGKPPGLLPGLSPNSRATAVVKAAAGRGGA